MQNYILISITCSPVQAEFLMAELGELNYEGFLETDSGVEAFIPVNEYKQEDLNQILEQYGVTKEQVHVSEVAQQNWNEEWERSFEPVCVTDKVRIRAPFHLPDPNTPIELIIQPKTSFGTGHHETTAAIIELMLDLPLKKISVLDFGSGTGILAILAVKLGASQVFANDIDPWASENILENMELNKISNITFRQGDLSVVPNETFDCILANLNRNILLQNLGGISRLLNPGGKVLVSGFYLADLPAISEKAESCGLKPIRQITRNDWTAALFESTH